MRSIYSLLYLLFISQFIWAQKYNPTEIFTINQGLSHNDISCLYSDSRGFLWIGTTDGLNRYDGYSFKKYVVEQNKPSSIPNDHIYKISEDNNNNLWCASEGGLFKLDLLTNTFTSFTEYIDTLLFPELSPVYDFVIDISGNRIFFLSKHYYGKLDLSSKYIERYPLDNSYFSGDFDKKACIEINYNDNSLLIANNERIISHSIEKDSLSFLFDSFGRQFLREGGIRGVLYGLNQEIWVYTSKNVWFCKTDQELIRLSSINNALDYEQNVIALEQISDTTIEIFTSQGLFIYNFNKLSIVKTIVFNYSSNEYFVSSNIRDISGVSWLGTNNGLLKYNHHKNVFSHYSLSESNGRSISGNISCAVFDANGKLWLGFSSGNLIIADTKSKSFNKSILVNYRNNSRIHSLKESTTGSIFVCSDEGLTEYFIPQRNVYTTSSIRSKNYPIDDIAYAVNDDIPATLWVSMENEASTMEYSLDQYSYSNLSSEIMLSEPCLEINVSSEYVYLLQPFMVLQIELESRQVQHVSFSDSGRGGATSINTVLALNDEDILIGTSDGLFEYNSTKHYLCPYELDSVSINYCINSLVSDDRGRIWMSTSGNIISIDQKKNKISFFNAQDGLSISVFSGRGAAKSPDGRLLFFGKKEFVIFHPDSLINNDKTPEIIITSAILSGKETHNSRYLIGVDTLNIEPEYSNFRINFAALNFWNPKRNQYKYSLELIGKTDKWQSLGNKNYIEFFGLKTGIYSFKLMGSNSNDLWNPDSRELIIHIKAPIWKSRIAIVLYTIALIVLFYFSVYFTTRQLRKINKEYKEKEHISKKIELQKEELSIKNKNITDSINYAKRIQMALMPSQKLFSNLFPDSFILHIPKDIVSGDFYWINEVGGRIYFASVDCTGHGVPGAFMSVIGFDLFRRITETEKKKQPAEILNSLSRGFETVFRDVENVAFRDGMDVAFCAIDHDMKVLEFAGAFNPLYLVRDNTITEIKGDRFSVGLNEDDTDFKSFNNHVIPLADGDVIYIFTDGFADQFGGPEGKKYKYRRFRHLLLALHQLPMKRQGEFLRRSILDWKGSLDQVDDILVVGIRIGHSQP